jgi:NAD(P)-dependent dehydrogenase (short-subunit alcohol dehydrogenase family)
MNDLLRGRVAIVTGAGGGLGRSHAHALAQAGARVVVNDIGEAAQMVAAEIVEAGGEAVGFVGSVTDVDRVGQMVADTVARWGAVDILVNNAGILRDKSFAKMSLDDFRLVVEVHLMGAAICTKSVWSQMQAQNYGRIIFTTSSSGLYGNFGQSNYAAAKMGLIGLMQTLALEGAKYDIRVNALAPSAATKMTESLYPPEVLARLAPERVSPGIVALACEDAPSRAILLAGAGNFAAAHVTMTRGIYVDKTQNVAETILDRLDELTDREGESTPGAGIEQHQMEVARAIAALNLQVELKDA